MRNSVDLPAPFGPTIATASPCWTKKEIPARARSLRRAMGCSSARHPECAGGKYFSSASTEIAGDGITSVITDITRANPVPSLLFGASDSRMEAVESISAGRVDRTGHPSPSFQAEELPQPKYHGSGRNGRTSLLTYDCCRCTRTGLVSSRRGIRDSESEEQRLLRHESGRRARL